MRRSFVRPCAFALILSLLAAGSARSGSRVIGRIQPAGPAAANATGLTFDGSRHPLVINQYGARWRLDIETAAITHTYASPPPSNGSTRSLVHDATSGTYLTTRLNQ